MFIFDIETLGTESDSVILSAAIIHFDSGEDCEFSVLKENACFVKFNVLEQVQVYSRKIERSTVDWWNKQCENVRRKSFYPSKDDLSLAEGYSRIQAYVESMNDSDCWIWARGNMDQVCFSSIEKNLNVDNSLLPHYRWRDIRTAIDFLYNTKNGYVKVETPPWMKEFNPDIHITKHDPVDDCLFDIMQLKYGKQVL